MNSANLTAFILCGVMGCLIARYSIAFSFVLFAIGAVNGLYFFGALS